MNRLEQTLICKRRTQKKLLIDVPSEEAMLTKQSPPASGKVRSLKAMSWQDM